MWLLKDMCDCHEDSENVCTSLIPKKSGKYSLGSCKSFWKHVYACGLSIGKFCFVIKSVNGVEYIGIQNREPGGGTNFVPINKPITPIYAYYSISNSGVTSINYASYLLLTSTMGKTVLQGMKLVTTTPSTYVTAGNYLSILTAGYYRFEFVLYVNSVTNTGTSDPSLSLWINGGTDGYNYIYPIIYLTANEGICSGFGVVILGVGATVGLWNSAPNTVINIQTTGCSFSLTFIRE